MKKKTELAIDEDLLRFAKAAADENGITLVEFVEDIVYEHICERHARKSPGKPLGLVKTPVGDFLTEEELEKRRLAVEKSWGYMRVDREIVEAMLREPSNLDV